MTNRGCPSFRGVAMGVTDTGSAQWQTMVCTTLCFAQLAHVLAIRSERESLFTQGLFSNRPFLGALLLTFLPQLATIYVPFLNGIFRGAPLSAAELALTLGIASVVFWAVEGKKWLRRRRERAGG
ncbi:MAG: cation transporting ATPase C-terminal domain-containing protein [Candidatus Entotheonellia bacterium]